MFDIHFLTPADLPLLLHAADDVFDNLVDPAQAAAFLADSRHHIVVATVDGVVIGFASAVHYVHPDKPPELWINEVGVAGAYQGRGIGKAIMHAMLTLGRQLGCVNAWVLTEDDNSAARNLYRSAGGVETTTNTIMVEFKL